MSGDEEWAAQWAAEAAAFMEAETARIMRDVNAASQAAMTAAWADDESDEDAELEAAPHPIVTRRDYVPKDEEARYLTRDEAGSLTLRLVDAGDRLAVWSPLFGGGLINPKGPGMRSLGLVATYARGSSFHAAAFRTADLRMGKAVDLRREPQNRHDRNAVALYSPGAREPFGYVQRGRAASIARRMDAGEHMAGVSLRGPGRGRDDDTAFLLLGSAADLQRLLA